MGTWTTTKTTNIKVRYPAGMDRGINAKIANEIMDAMRHGTGIVMPNLSAVDYAEAVKREPWPVEYVGTPTAPWATTPAYSMRPPAHPAYCGQCGDKLAACRCAKVSLWRRIVRAVFGK